MKDLNFKQHEDIYILNNTEVIIASVATAKDLLGEVYGQGLNKVIVNDSVFSPDFFDLSTGLLGEVLQKYTNYHLKMAIISDFSKYKSKVLPDFIRESNKGQQFFFVKTKEEAIEKFRRL